jgi:hypothetical protein
MDGELTSQFMYWWLTHSFPRVHLQFTKSAILTVIPSITVPKILRGGHAKKTPMIVSDTVEPLVEHSTVKQSKLDWRSAMSKSTPGPWSVVCGLAADDFIVTEPSGNTICEPNAPLYTDLREFEPDARKIERDEALANAQLIAAAPEMLEALKLSAKEWAHEAPDDCYSTGPYTGDVIQDHVVCPACVMLRTINAAILKAEGKA